MGIFIRSFERGPQPGRSTFCSPVLFDIFEEKSTKFYKHLELFIRYFFNKVLANWEKKKLHFY